MTSGSTFYETELVYQRASSDVERVVRGKAVRATCALAVDAHDAEYLLDVLGLRPEEGRDDVASFSTEPTTETDDHRR